MLQVRAATAALLELTHSNYVASPILLELGYEDSEVDCGACVCRSTQCAAAAVGKVPSSRMPVRHPRAQQPSEAGSSGATASAASEAAASAPEVASSGAAAQSAPTEATAAQQQFQAAQAGAACKQVCMSPLNRSRCSMLPQHVSCIPADCFLVCVTVTSGMLFPWERRQFDGAPGGLKTWEKLYWGVFVTCISLYLFSRIARPNTTQDTKVQSGQAWPHKRPCLCDSPVVGSFPPDRVTRQHF